jgi:HD superfamily phosphohydrolase YqeK
VSIEFPAWAVVGDRRREHIARVTALVGSWADAMGVGEAEARRWRTAAVLHDALRDAGPEALARYTPQGDWPVKLWHGPAAAVAAEQDGIADAGILSAIRYHSVGWTGWDRAGRMLFLADFLEPGRRYHDSALAILSERVPREPEAVFREVVARRIAWAGAAGKTVRPETAALWSQLV